MHVHRVTGRAFEDAALEVARSIHDPARTQGSVMFEGRERDGVFISDTAIVAFEFTQLRSKDKASKDGNKLADLLSKLSKESEHRFKSAQGYFVTEDEPTGDQRSEIAAISRRTGVPLKTLSLTSLRKQLVDAQKYLELRRGAPFGSTAFTIPGGEKAVGKYVPPTLEDQAGQIRVLSDVFEQVRDGQRFVIQADFGAGKSEALRQGFETLRNRFLRKQETEHFPLHINLRDCYGLRTPTEILTRHAEEIGFPDERGLISAWRSGEVTLLLDGFDEIVPARWGGGARDLRSVRWQALEPVRRLIGESTPGVGVIVVGRPQYFADVSELLDTLGLTLDDAVLSLRDFDDEQLQSLLDDPHAVVPEWVPTRPLLVRYLAQIGVLSEVANDESMDEASAWSKMLELLATREADRIAAVPPDRVRELIARVATVARTSEGAGGTGMGEVSVSAMRDAFRAVCGFEPDDEGIQLLLRLPGLAATGTGSADVRQFVDRSLAEACYGFDLAKYVASPYQAHPLSARVSWPASTAGLAPAVAQIELARLGFSPEYVTQAIEARMNADSQDAILFDLLAVADDSSVKPGKTVQPFFRDLLIADIKTGPPESYMASSLFKDCVVERLDLDGVQTSEEIPQFVGTLVGLISGVSSIPPGWTHHFTDCEIIEFAEIAETTSSILELELPRETVLALMVLKKVYAQAGTGRKLSGLVRGVPRDERGAVGQVVEQLISSQLLIKQVRRGVELLIPVKGRRPEVLGYLERPSSFEFSS